MEACEHYQKQSYRNRCRIATANGVEDLSFPIKHSGSTFNTPIKEIRVDYSTPWLQKTKRCIDSAYHSSAFFDYYRDSLYAVLDRKSETLWELDMSIIEYFMAKIGLKSELLETKEYMGAPELIHPKRPNTILSDMGLDGSYYQVFSNKFGFIPNLSIMDLLFNEGPASLEFILESSPQASPRF